MDHTRFRKPVDILVGLGFPRRIESAMEACILLQDWPYGERNRAHAVARPFEALVVATADRMNLFEGWDPKVASN